jgi:hypothetical protein
MIKKNQIVGRRKQVIQMEDDSNQRLGGIVMQTRVGGIHDLPKQQLQRRERAAKAGSSRLVPTQILDPVNAESVSGERADDPIAPTVGDMSQIRMKNRSELQRIRLRLQSIQRMEPSEERTAEIRNLREQAKAFSRHAAELEEGQQQLPQAPIPAFHPNDVRPLSNQTAKEERPLLPPMTNGGGDAAPSPNKKDDDILYKNGVPKTLAELLGSGASEEDIERFKRLERELLGEEGDPSPLANPAPPPPPPRPDSPPPVPPLAPPPVPPLAPPPSLPSPDPIVPAGESSEAASRKPFPLPDFYPPEFPTGEKRKRDEEPPPQPQGVVALFNDQSNAVRSGREKKWRGTTQMDDYADQRNWEKRLAEQSYQKTLGDLPANVTSGIIEKRRKEQKYRLFSEDSYMTPVDPNNPFAAKKTELQTPQGAGVNAVVPYEGKGKEKEEAPKPKKKRKRELEGVEAPVDENAMVDYDAKGKGKGKEEGPKTKKSKPSTKEKKLDKRAENVRNVMTTLINDNEKVRGLLTKKALPHEAHSQGNAAMMLMRDLQKDPRKVDDPKFILDVRKRIDLMERREGMSFENSSEKGREYYEGLLKFLKDMVEHSNV